MRKYDKLFVNFHALHLNADEWQRPLEFLPERFDLDHPLSNTPKGTKRLPHSWAPFAGGKRMCFGKTFAETALKITLTYLSQNFDFEFLDKKYMTQLPNAHVGLNKRNKIEVSLTKRND